MKKIFLLRNFDPILNETISHGKDVYLYTKNKKKYLDATAGLTGVAILGWGNKKIEQSMIKQLKKIGHIDYKYFLDENREKLSSLLLSQSKNKLDKVFFVGGSGGEACEGAMKMSYQYHLANGKKNKKWFISRKQSFHGSSSDAISVGDRPNLNIYKSFFSTYRTKISENNIYRHMKRRETEKDYTKRCVRELENKILSLGPDNVCAFIGETIMGGLVGDVPPSINYWKEVRRVCTKYKVHLILDEVWCGGGTTGKPFCIDWDKVTPDFVFVGKTLAAGYGPLSAVITKSEIGSKIKKKLGAIQVSTTYQGHSLGVAASLEVQSIIQNKNFLKNVCLKGEYLRETLGSELKNHEFFKNVRGRGMRNSLEYNCSNNHLFGCHLGEYAKNQFNLLISAKYHRVCFSPAINISFSDLNQVVDNFLKSFKYVAANWKKLRNKNFSYRNFY